MARAEDWVESSVLENSSFSANKIATLRERIPSLKRAPQIIKPTHETENLFRPFAICYLLYYLFL
jgi:hypothetical protein